MAISIVMPALELAQETGTLVSWRKREGDHVSKGEPLLEVETDKAVVEVESPADGILASVGAQAGDVVAVGTIIAWLVAPGEAAPYPHGSQGSLGSLGSPGVGSAKLANPENPAHPANPTTNPLTLPSEEIAKLVSPKARRIARERGIDLSLVRGSGPNGEILVSDIEVAALPPAPQAPASADRQESLGAVGRLMAERMVQSWTTVPHFFIRRDADASNFIAVHGQLAAAIEKASGVVATYTDLLIPLIARTLGKHPRLNASWAQAGVQMHREINVGLAVAVDAGTVVVVFPGADTMTVADVALKRRDLVERARAGRLQVSDITGATFTISNLGMFQIDSFTAIIVPPQAAILAVGAIANRVVPIGNDGLGVRPVATLTLSCDHRTVDGARGAAFLNDLVKAIQDPRALGI